MVAQDPRRESHFPSIEKKYGEPISHWLTIMAKIGGKKYPEQIAHLRVNYGFSQAHANALVMYSRGSTTAHRHESLSDYFKSIDPKQAKTVKAIFKAITTKYSDLEFVIAWNQPMLRQDKKYIIGVSVAKNHILINPFSNAVIEKFTPKFADLKVNKKTVALPNDWVVDAKLLQAMAKMRLAE